jgi:hypothetical protein
MATVDLREGEVRRIGLALNDPKTVIRRGDTYEVSLKRLLDDCLQDRCLARLGLGVRRRALHAAAHQVLVWLSFGLQSVGHRRRGVARKGTAQLVAALPTLPSFPYEGSRRTRWRR